MQCKFLPVNHQLMATVKCVDISISAAYGHLTTTVGQTLWCCIN